MSAGEVEFARRAAELRRAFDAAFAEPVNDTRPEHADLLLLRVTSEVFALDLVDVAGVHVKKHITRFPTPIPELLGVAAFRGTLVSVHDARGLLGYQTQRPPETVVLTKLGFALAFDAFESHLRIERTALARAAPGAHASRLVRSVLRTPEGVRPIIHLPALEQVLRAKLPPSRT